MRKHVFAILLLLAMQAPAQMREPPLTGAERTRWFREAKFGMFIHWGPYAVLGRHEWARHRFQIPQAEYDAYARAFNPVRFDAKQWVSIAENAGAKYIVITSKHHDGFSIYRSRVSDYDMEITPYPGDPLKMLAAACRERGMRLGFYHSIMDWHHPDYRPRRPWESTDPKSGGNLNRYIDFMKTQLRELMTGYGDVAVVWFDGEWEHSNEEHHADEVYDMLRALQPNTLINDRLFKRAPGNRGDFGTPEQFVPATGVTGPDGKPVLWESCVTINQDSWGYNKYETDFKTSRDLIRMLIEVVSKGGNLLLNVGPMPDGRMQDEFVTRLNADSGNGWGAKMLELEARNRELRQALDQRERTIMRLEALKEEAQARLRQLEQAGVVQTELRKWGSQIQDLRQYLEEERQRTARPGELRAAIDSPHSGRVRAGWCRWWAGVVTRNGRFSGCDWASTGCGWTAPTG